MSEPRVRKLRITKTDYDLAAGFLRDMGATVAYVDLEPGKALIVTTEGKGLTLPREGVEDIWSKTAV